MGRDTVRLVAMPLAPLDLVRIVGVVAVAAVVHFLVMWGWIPSWLLDSSIHGGSGLSTRDMSMLVVLLLPVELVVHA